ncbi:MAG: hypothetical protein JNM76_01175 [Betaproteobacteria bacterium]|nr:hypothetical protein [Betaproteobacteria bacterium]
MTIVDDPHMPLQILRDVQLSGQRMRLSKPVAVGRLEYGQAPVPAHVRASAKEDMSPAETVAPTESAVMSAMPSVSDVTPQHLESVLQRGYEAGFEQGQRDGHSAGLQAGHQAGFEEGMVAAQEESARQVELAASEATKELQQVFDQRITDAVNHLAALRERIELEFSRRLEQAEDEVLTLSWEIACRVIGPAACTPEAVSHMVRQALQEWRSRRPVTILLNPDDFALLQGPPGRLAKLIEDIPEAKSRISEWLPDPAIEWGGCVIRSVAGGLDARLDFQLQVLKEALAKARSLALGQLGDSR